MIEFIEGWLKRPEPPDDWLYVSDPDNPGNIPMAKRQENYVQEMEVWANRMEEALARVQEDHTSLNEERNEAVHQIPVLQHRAEEAGKAHLLSQSESDDVNRRMLAALVQKATEELAKAGQQLELVRIEKAELEGQLKHDNIQLERKNIQLARESMKLERGRDDARRGMVVALAGLTSEETLAECDGLSKEQIAKNYGWPELFEGRIL